MRIVQILPVIAFGDAIGNHVIALSKIFNDNGYKCKVYAEVVDSRLPVGTAQSIEQYKKQDGDVILYHMSTGSPLNRKVLDYGVPVILNYHNITPPEFFAKYNKGAEKSCKDAREDLAYLADKVQGCISDSQYNQQELVDLGYTCKMTVIPILIAFDDYKKKPDNEVIKECKDGYTNILFVGRVVPNKKQEDLIEAFYYYKKHYNPKSRLIIAGSFAGIDDYVKELKWYVNWLELEDVIFTGQISFPKILAYYHAADMFLCMSEHEGFCVPLVESMYFGVPIIACESTAIADTLGNAGILLQEKKPLETAAVMNYLMEHKELQEAIKENQKERLEQFEHKRIADKFLVFFAGL